MAMAGERRQDRLGAEKTGRHAKTIGGDPLGQLLGDTAGLRFGNEPHLQCQHAGGLRGNQHSAISPQVLPPERLSQRPKPLLIEAGLGRMPQGPGHLGHHPTRLGMEAEIDGFNRGVFLDIEPVAPGVARLDACQFRICPQPPCHEALHRFPVVGQEAGVAVDAPHRPGADHAGVGPGGAMGGPRSAVGHGIGSIVGIGPCGVTF